MRLVSRVSTLREESNIRAWLRAVAVNVARSAARRRPIRPVVELDEGGVAALGPDQLEQAERTGRLMDRLRELPVLYREPLMLRAVHGMRTRQIADILDLPPATIDTRIARARRMLRDGIEDLSPAPEGGPDHSAEAPR